MTDKLISLQAAIEAVEFGITYAKAIDTKTGEVRELFKQSNEELRKAAERIKALPSAQPESEAISKWKKEFREYVDSLDIARDDWKGIVEYIDELLSAQPEIIYCKDCKWCVEHYDTDGNVPYWICKNWDAGTDADGFCHEAERREDATD